MAKKKLTYKTAGVDRDLADNLIEKLVPMFRSTNRKGVVGAIGGFGGLFEAPTKGLKRPLLVGATDGVGTKLLVAQAVGKHDTIGIDLVAMNVNDVICSGAEPLFFLDYFATGGIEPRVYTDVLKGIVEGCRQANCALIGGETAEMPGLYKKGEYDLAGFCVGVVDRGKVLDGRKIRPGDVLLGLASSGLHSNGYSLARRIFTKGELGGAWGRMLLEPTRIYVRPVLKLRSQVDILGLAHITGSGLEGNVPRCLPKGVAAWILKDSWDRPAIFQEIERRGVVDEAELFRTFNMGLGLVMVVRAKEAERARKLLAAQKVKSFVLGEIVKHPKGPKAEAEVFLD